MDKKFTCDLSKCKGACCVQGDSGAPLEHEELEILETIFPIIKKYLRPEGIKAIEEQGPHVMDSDNDNVTPLIEGKECAYVIFEEGIAKCGIEKAYFDGAIKFQKPVSCHLYPVRVKRLNGFVAVNYDKWDICNPARILGEEIKMPVFQFVKDALVRKFGSDWYKHLNIASVKLNNTPHPDGN